MVKVKVNGALEFQEIIIDPSVVDPAEVGMLQDLVLAAVRDGLEKASSLASEAIGQVGLPGMGGLLGGGAAPGLPGLPGGDQ